MIHALADELQQKNLRLERLENRIPMLLRRYYGPAACACSAAEVQWTSELPVRRAATT